MDLAEAQRDTISVENEKLEAARCPNCSARIHPATLIDAHLVRCRRRPDWFSQDLRRLQLSLNRTRHARISLVIPDVVAVGPERSLWLTVLLLALSDLAGAGVREGNINLFLQEEARRWVFCDSEWDVGSFNFVCETLGLDPGRIRDDLHSTTTIELRARFHGFR